MLHFFMDKAPYADPLICYLSVLFFGGLSPSTLGTSLAGSVAFMLAFQLLSQFSSVLSGHFFT